MKMFTWKGYSDLQAWHVVVIIILAYVLAGV